jgi:hypothetical protein
MFYYILTFLGLLKRLGRWWGKRREGELWEKGKGLDDFWRELIGINEQGQ